MFDDLKVQAVDLRLAIDITLQEVKRLVSEIDITKDSSVDGVSTKKCENSI